ncbi:MAG: C40 family peptidase [Acidimicrobiales bacterium]
MRPAEGSLAAARTQGRSRILGAIGGRVRRIVLVVLGSVTLVGGIAVPAALSTPGAGAQSVASLRQQADGLAAQIQIDYAKLSVLDEGYNQAQLQVTSIESQVRAATHAIGRAQAALLADKARLRTVAIDAYVQGDSTAGLTMLLSGSSRQLPMQQAYMSAASGDLGQAEATMTSAKHNLAVHRGALVGAERAARAVRYRIVLERDLAEHITAQLEQELASVKGSLARAVAYDERQRQLQLQAAAQAAALASQQQAAQAAASLAPTQTTANQGAPNAVTTPAPPPPPVSGGGSGAVAVRAAESQLGVPYVWGGASPGSGFDCSGLTMWSWAQAGVSLAHGATEQYYEIAHVSMSNLQPGDLIFYGDSSYLYHVVMYVGSGPYGSSTVIQAENTGTNVMFTPIPPGAYGAGQP